MKKIGMILSIFTLSIIFGVSGVSAKGDFLSFGGITLGSRSSVYTSGAKSKTEKSLQYIYTTGATDKLTGGNRAVSAQVYGINGSEWISAPRGQYVSWAEDWTKNTGAYYIKLKATKSTLAAVSYSGIWYLDDTIVNK